MCLRRVGGDAMGDSRGKYPVHVQRRLRVHRAAEDVAAEKPGQVLGDLVADEASLPHSEYKVQVLERPPLGLLEQQEDEDKGHEVEAREQAQRAALPDLILEPVSMIGGALVITRKPGRLLLAGTGTGTG